MNLKYLNFFVAFFLIVFSSCSNEPKEIKQPRKDSGAPLKAEAYVIKPLALNASLQIAGTLKPYEETEIHPEVSGRVVQLSLREGSFVNKGTVLARLFDGDLQAQLNKLNVQLQIARKTRERQDQLLKIGGISQQDFDLSVLNESTIVADIQIMKAEIAKTVIRAPFSGKIGFKNISIGAYITPATVITTIQQVNKLKLEFSIPEKYANEVKKGNTIYFTTETSDARYAAQIAATEPGITQETRTLKVQAIVTKLDDNIASGGFANVQFKLGENESAVMIPTQAIIPEARDKKVVVYRQGVADFVTITTGVRDSAKVEILKGLAIGDTIITTGLLSIKPGSKVQISSYKK